MSKHPDLAVLVSRFKTDFIKLTTAGSTYSETEARAEYIDPLLRLLGWDMDNSAGQPNSLKDVVREESQEAADSESPKRPDYTFRIGSIRKFFTEAKKPSVDIRKHRGSAFQVRSYGYTVGLPISVLTNFRTLRVYDTRLEPKSTDDADVGLIESIDFEELEAKFDNLISKLSRDSVSLGSIEAHYGVTPSGAVSPSDKFLVRINDWRLRIASDLHGRYSTLSADELSDLAQKVINRVIFIRMCEDRGIEGAETLRKVAGKKNVVELRALFKKLDVRYNTGLFDVASDRLQDKYELDTQLFFSIVDEVYSPFSPYSFAVLDADFLGRVYELFLAKRIEISGPAIHLVAKPAYEDREIVTTPQPLVDEVVRRAIAARLSTAPVTTFAQLLQLKLLDIAVGSGRFLAHALDKLVDKAIEVLRAGGNDPRVYQISTGSFRLSFEAKKQLLENCLFGIDIDFNAVEVARFSLMAKLLEDETSATLPSGNKILPNLDGNIIWGNSVVGKDFSASTDLVREATVPFDWVDEGLPARFDVIIGNPPYVNTEDMRAKTQEEFDYYKARYSTPFRQFDKYFVFVERALASVVSSGSVGLLIPNKWMTIESGKKLREHLTDGNFVAEIVDFGNESLFAGKSAYVCILVLKKSGASSFDYRHINDQAVFEREPSAAGYVRPTAALVGATPGDAWLLPADAAEALVLATLIKSSHRLGAIADVSNGIQTSKNDVFLIKDFTDLGPTIAFQRKGVSWEIEKSITRSYVDDSAKVRTFSFVVGDALVIFPYESLPGEPPRVIPPAKMRSKYPLAWAYLSHFKPELVKRSVNPAPPAGVFWAYGRHQALETVFSAPKIVYSVNQLGDKYGFDSMGVAVASGGTAGEVMVLNPRGGYALEFFLGLLSQRAIEYFVRKRGSPFGSGYYSRGTAVLADVPVPVLDLSGNTSDITAHDAVVANVKALLAIKSSIESASGRGLKMLERQFSASQALLKAKFDALWGFTVEQDGLVLPGE